MGRIANAIKDYKNLKNERLGGFYANDFIEILDMSTSEFEIMANSFNDYESESLLYYTIFFISLIILTILAYFIVWKIYEEKLKLLLKGSVDLINLIPQEIKSIIAEKLNE